MSLPLYFVEMDGRSGPRFIEIDRDSNSAGAVRCLIRNDPDVIKVLEVHEPSDEYPRGQCLDVTDEMRAEALAGVVPEPREFDRQAAKWDHDRDLRKHGEPA